MNLASLIEEALSGINPRPMFTLERGRGETYSHNEPVLYAHSTYEDGSVLAGQDRRVYIEQWKTWEEARSALAEARHEIPSFSYTDFGDGNGMTYIPSRAMTRHLPDTDDW